MKHLLALAVLLFSFNVNAALVFMGYDYAGFYDRVEPYNSIFSANELYLSSGTVTEENGDFNGQVFNTIYFTVTRPMSGLMSATQGATTRLSFGYGFYSDTSRVYRLFPGIYYTLSMSMSVDTPTWGFVRMVAEDYVAPVPLPTSAFLLAPALLGLMALRRPRRSRYIHSCKAITD